MIKLTSTLKGIAYGSLALASVALIAKGTYDYSPLFDMPLPNGKKIYSVQCRDIESFPPTRFYLYDAGDNDFQTTDLIAESDSYKIILKSGNLFIDYNKNGKFEFFIPYFGAISKIIDT